MMVVDNVRLYFQTRKARKVLRVLQAVQALEPCASGYSICRASGYRAGTLYSILARLARAGYLTSAWETPEPQDRPRRRFYTVTDSGRTKIRELRDRV